MATGNNITKAAEGARPGRFFDDMDALDDEIRRGVKSAMSDPVDVPKAEHKGLVNFRALGKLVNLTKAYVAAHAVFIGRRTLALHNGLADRIDQLERRLAEVEGEPLAYKGTHEVGRLYERNSVVTHAGSMWVALRRTQQRPGDGGDAWQLAVKAGRDAR